MTHEEFTSLLKTIPWFSRLGEPFDVASFDVAVERLPNLEAWKSVTEILPDEPVPDLIERGMQWLPTQAGTEDPVRGTSLEELAKKLNKQDEFRRAGLEAYRTVLSSLRSWRGHPLLNVGPHDYTEVARGSAAYAARRAAHELVIGECGIWSSVLRILQTGHWPLGRLPAGTLVVL